LRLAAAALDSIATAGCPVRLHGRTRHRSI